MHKVLKVNLGKEINSKEPKITNGNKVNNLDNKINSSVSKTISSQDKFKITLIKLSLLTTKITKILHKNKVIKKIRRMRKKINNKKKRTKRLRNNRKKSKRKKKSRNKRKKRNESKRKKRLRKKRKDKRTPPRKRLKEAIRNLAKIQNKLHYNQDQLMKFQRT